MNKIKYLLFYVCISFVMMSGVNAAELKLSSTSQDVVNGDIVSVKLELNAYNEDIVIDYCQVSIESTESLQFSEIMALNSWTITNNNVNDKIMDINIKNYQSGLSGVINIADLKYTISESGSVKINSASCFDKEGKSLDSVAGNYNDLTINTVLPSVTSLKSLKIEGEELKPHFSPNVTSYSINNLQSNVLFFEYELADSSYNNQVKFFVNDIEVTSLNEVPFQLSGDNKTMLVTIKIGEESSYNIFVSKSGANNYTEYLNSIIVNGTPIELVTGKYDYEYIVKDDVTDAIVTAELYDADNFVLGDDSNISKGFSMPGKAMAVLNVVPKNRQSGIPSATYTVTIKNESYVETGVSNPDTADTSMVIIATILVVSLIGSAFLYKKNLKGYQ